MSFQTNPFIRGYWGLYAQRSLKVICNGHTARLLLHSSQEHFRDCEVAQKPCIICNGYAISGTAEFLSEDLTAYCNKYGYDKGFVTNARYAILANENGRSVHLGDVPSLKEANEIIHRLTFKPGFFNRCWEISAAHLEKAAVDYLERIIKAAEPLDFFSAFRIEYAQIGVKLSSVDWSHASMQYTYGVNAVELFLEHLKNGMPISLAKLLYLAGEADVRFLIFAHGAPELRGLPVFDR